jgi:glyoxylase-like metal-dependent hydrolase (beta-lactamase superfamily II)
MTYTGDVTPGGPPAVRELAQLTITKASVGPMDNNAYLLRCGGEQLLIDAANDAARLLALIGTAPLATVVTTHRHGDHRTPTTRPRSRSSPARCATATR